MRVKTERIIDTKTLRQTFFGKIQIPGRSLSKVPTLLHYST